MFKTNKPANKQTNIKEGQAWPGGDDDGDDDA